MIRTCTILVLLFTTISATIAQTPAPAPKAVQAFGKIDKADLELKECAFEKDANAMVLFEKGDVYFDDKFNVTIEVHKRIKIFNESGKKQADIRIPYYGGNRAEYVNGLQAETINLNDGKVEITKVDRKQIFTENVDKSKMAMVFSFPNVKPGSVIEFSYRKVNQATYGIPDWYFQSEIPVRYSEFNTSIPEFFYYRLQPRVYQAFQKNTTSSENRAIQGSSFSEDHKTFAMANVSSLNSEPYMRSFWDNVQSIHMQLESIKPTFGFTQQYSESWDKVTTNLLEDEDFGLQFKRKLVNEEAIISKAKSLKSDDAKIGYIFSEVKNAMKWDGTDRWYTMDGTAKAWDKKIGNSTEINLILYRLLAQSGVKAYPMVVSTRSNGRINPAYTNLTQFNRAVVFIPIDSTQNYVLDASDKYNSYRETPENLLYSHGFWVDKESKQHAMVFLDNPKPVRQAVFVNAEIKPDGTLNGTAQINSFSYNRHNAIEHYKTDGEKKYIDYLREDNNSLSINSLKLANMDLDSLPLTQSMNFNLELTGSDKDYIYFNPNLFTSLHSNPFLSENRNSDIDFGYLNQYNINGLYKIPAGYKSDALPKSLSIVMPDNSITFKRIVAEQDGVIAIRYSIDYKKVLFFKEDYSDLHAFYKKMHELLNEQVVLKKS
ncbi:DUF3857 domain-containing protein [Mucilaginibacter lacusdianchii]|uniref:DUF3857 domain-containing protein n=1 Tax=Mucilaginibacter lacusdianchii TaxID=2684211 RepID=UPI00131C6C59|nr:DUF3857 domain-containing protein [Mucilaginibacter sp. JXJ CY 39]